MAQGIEALSAVWHETRKPNPPFPVDRILIARLSAMGDIVHSLPAVAELRMAFPKAKIGWIIDERWVELLAARSAIDAPAGSPEKPLVDVIHAFDVRAWRADPFSTKSRASVKALLADLRAEQYQVSVDLQAAIRSALLNWLSHAPVRVGFRIPRELPARIFYTRTAKTRSRHVVEHGLELASVLTGAPPFPAFFALPHHAEARESMEKLRLAVRGARHAVVVPGAGWGAKRWPAERYGAVAHGLKQQGLEVFVNAGPGEEELANEVVSASRGAAHAVRASLAELIELLRRAEIVIGGDTGPVHLAAGCGVAVVAIYGPTNPARNGPYAPGGLHSRVTVLRSGQSQTSHARKSQPEAGLLEITIEQVVNAALPLLLGTRQLA